MKSPILACIAFGIAAALCTPAIAIQTCELNGESVNPNKGGTTQGKSGLMRCRESDTGVVVREQELQNGKFMGVVRYFKSGQLEREFSVNERGNREGVSREWNVADGKHVLVREESTVNSKTTGIVRTWFPTGQRRRLGFYGGGGDGGDGDGEQASVEFTLDGKLYALRCAPRPVFGSEFDDKAACGHGGSVSTVELFNGKGVPASRLSFERGERRKVETLWDNGSVHELRETNAAGGLERSFAADGTKRRELQWVTIAAAASTSANARPRNIDTLEQEFHESGKLIHERKWVPANNDADLVSESHWYLNGQLKDRSEFSNSNGKRVRHDTSFYDNGKPASEGNWLLAESKFARNDAYGAPFGSHKSFDDQGRLRGERLYDDRGRLTREREFDERGTVVRDDEVFEDGSRKSAGK
jgi:antitoxin component YwqK of YwqJK toxin-antitoxin module